MGESNELYPNLYNFKCLEHESSSPLLQVDICRSAFVREAKPIGFVGAIIFYTD